MQKKLSRKEREKLAHKEEILSAALKIFSEKGFHLASMQEIAKKAEFSIGTLYNFFSNKEELYRELIIEKVKKENLRLIESLESYDDEYKSIANFVEIHGKVFMENESLFKLYVTETREAMLNMRLGLCKELLEFHNIVIDKLCEIFKSGIKKGKFLNLPPYELAISLNSLCNSFIIFWIESPKKNKYEPEKILKIFFDSVKIN